MVSFEWSLDPTAPGRFFADYYERQPLLVAGADRRRFERLVSLGAIDRFLASTQPAYPEVFLVDAARQLSAEDYTLTDADGSARLDLPRAYELFRTGATISLRRLNEKSAELAGLCRAMEKVFSGHFQTNIYLSPPRAQGFGAHFDSHDVFVLQVAGSKVWTLYDTPIELPLHGQGYDKDKHVPGAPSREIVLAAGDLFYCPRGLMHSARASQQTSLHITLGLIGKTWADLLLEAVSAACLASPAFRANLPVGFADPNFDASAASVTFRALIDSFARQAELRPTLERFAVDFVSSRRADFAGTLLESEAGAGIIPASLIEARPHLIYRLRHDGSELTLLFASTRLSFPIAAAEAITTALAGKPFAVGDLPGRLDAAGKIVLVTRLLKEGLLQRCGNPSAHTPNQGRAP